MLTNPDAYDDKKDLAGTAKEIRDDVDDYFSRLLAKLKDEQDELNDQLDKLAAQYKQINTLIASKSATVKIPYVKPLYIDSNSDNDETIVVEKYDSSLDPLVAKLLSSSHYVADISTSFQGRQIGSWLFSGTKNYTLTLNTPTSPIFAITNSKSLLDEMLGVLSGESK